MLHYKKIVYRFVFAAIFLIGFTFFVYLQNLFTRFPDMDLSRSQLGVVSWYSETDPKINKHTANGEVFNDKDLTCASWDYEFGEKLLVINLMNGKWVVCRVNDRGPAKYLRREVDLTKTAFSRIANPRKGLLYGVVAPTSTKRKTGQLRAK
jgi:rare lipoprotein A (peptidoglycan hydrolase)